MKRDLRYPSSLSRPAFGGLQINHCAFVAVHGERDIGPGELRNSGTRRQARRASGYASASRRQAAANICQGDGCVPGADYT